MKKTVITILIGVLVTMGVLGAVLGVMYLQDDGKDKVSDVKSKYEVNLNTYNGGKVIEQNNDIESDTNKDNVDNDSKLDNETIKNEQNQDNVVDNYTGNNNVTLYLFHGSTCPYCLNAKEYLKTIIGDYKYLTIKTIEVWGNEANSDLLTKVREELGDPVKDGVPYIVISNNYHRTGYNSNIDSYIIEGIETAHKQDNYNDIVQKIIDENKDLEVVVEDLAID